MADAPAFAAETDLGYVVVDRARSSPALEDFAKRALQLEKLESDGSLVLYRPVSMPVNRHHRVVTTSRK